MKDSLKITGIIFLLLSPIILNFVYQNGTTETLTITVKDKERITYSVDKSTKSKYLIFTESETFENTDAWFSGKFSSSDLYGKLNKGESYTVKVYGFRVPFLSWYRNIVRIE